MQGSNQSVGGPPPFQIHRGLEGVRKGSGRGLEGFIWSSLDARKPQNPTKSEEYKRHPQGVLYIV
eukprot:390813-Pyramimonas_sp.AAC.1